jgi:hypothetical protein
MAGTAVIIPAQAKKAVVAAVAWFRLGLEAVPLLLAVWKRQPVLKGQGQLEL